MCGPVAGAVALAGAQQGLGYYQDRVNARAEQRAQRFNFNTTVASNRRMLALQGRSTSRALLSSELAEGAELREVDRRFQTAVASSAAALAGKGGGAGDIATTAAIQAGEAAATIRSNASLRENEILDQLLLAHENAFRGNVAALPQGVEQPSIAAAVLATLGAYGRAKMNNTKAV